MVLMQSLYLINMKQHTMVCQIGMKCRAIFGTKKTLDLNGLV
jgi:hypothetical protein